MAGYLCVGSGRNKPGLNEAGGSAAAVEALAAEAVRSYAPVQAVTKLKPTVLGDLLAGRVGSTRQPVARASGVGFQMIRINSLDLLLRSIETHLRSRSDGLSGAVSLECTETGERVTLGFGGGEVRFDADPAAERVALTERQMVQLVFGGHSSCEPLDLPAEGGPPCLSGSSPSTSPSGSWTARESHLSRGSADLGVRGPTPPKLTRPGT